MLFLREDESFSLTANVTSPGYQRVVLKGYLVSERPDGTYIAPLIPQLFYGAQGQQLTTWQQYIPQAGSQVILSRAAGGYPKVPREELWWRRVTPEEAIKEVPTVKPTLLEWFNALPWYMKILVIGGCCFTAAAGTLYLVAKKK